MESESAIIKDFDSTTKTSVNTMSARVSVVTLNSDRKQGDLNCVCVKIETDEWYNTAADLYSVCANAEQVLWEERQSDCNKNDCFNVVHEQTGCLQMDQYYTKQDCFTSECVKSEQTQYEIMQQDELHSVHGTTTQFLNKDPSYITSNDLNYVCGIAKQYIKTDTDNENRTENDQNALCDNSNVIVDQAQLTYLNSVFLTREEIELSNVDQYCATPTVGGETIQKDLYSNLDVHRHSNSKKYDSDDDFVEIFFERDKRKSESCHSTIVAPKRFLCEDSYSGVVKPMSLSASDSAENAVIRTAPLSLKPAEMKLSKQDDGVKKVKRIKKAKIPEKEKTKYSLQERNQASCMNLEPRDNDHFL
ncbi:hypothetical protein DPMN_168871 [Dreissena polymorpha]|uniref:Uncharacterized protein n=1 Tax=Dreissena polymorpha TaxID=45954 RepID=A0A9D4F3H7_DREPO|nr:hypothetical protein DPMN_168871 [Dreissena polymorpha]